MSTTVIPRYVPSNTIEDKFGFLITAVSAEGVRVYLRQDEEGWGPITEALFYQETLQAADAMKAAQTEDRLADDGIDLASLKLVKVIGLMVPTSISEDELRKKRRESAMAKLTPDEIEALGIDPAVWAEQERRRRQAGRR